MENNISNNRSISYNTLRISKILSFVIMTLALISAIGFLIIGSLAALLAIPFFFIAIYNLILGLVSWFLSKSSKINTIVAYIILSLVVIPMLWVLFDSEGLFNFLTQGIHLDMK